MAAKRRSMKSLQKAGSLKKLYVTFVSLALLFILSIILHFVFYKQFREGAQNMPDFFIEVSIIFYKDPTSGVVVETFEDTINFFNFHNYYKNRENIYVGKDDSSRIAAYKLPNSSILTGGDYPIGVLSVVSASYGRHYITHFTKIRDTNFVNTLTPYIG